MMKGDFTRDTFSAAHHFSRVLAQQGRVQLDADINEQTSILLHYLQQLAADMIGSHGGPCDSSCAFKLTLTSDAQKSDPKSVDFSIGSGHYYVDGILVEVEDPAASFQEHLAANSLSDSELDNANLEWPALIYLDVWERLITPLQEASIREVALEGADTAARAQVVWQVKLLCKGMVGWNEKAVTEALNQSQDNTPNADNAWKSVWQAWQPAEIGRLQAQCQQPGAPDDRDPCVIPPDNIYRGLENQLYRVEIHQGGVAGNASFKWSRDNGSVVFPIRRLYDMQVRLDGLGRDDRSTLSVGDWVEVMYDAYELAGDVGKVKPLYKISSVDTQNQIVILTPPADSNGSKLPSYDEAQAAQNHSLLRRWDHVFDENDDAVRQAGGAIPLQEDEWISLENGIEIRFNKSTPQTYRRGDYWLIPARTVQGDIEWPTQPDPNDSSKTIPKPLPPFGIVHHYAPLAYITAAPTVQKIDLRRRFKSLAIYGDETCT